MAALLDDCCVGIPKQYYLLLLWLAIIAKTSYSCHNSKQYNLAVFISCKLGYFPADIKKTKTIKICSIWHTAKWSELEIKNTAFADETTFISDGSHTSFVHLLDVINKFTCMLGLKLNSKTISHFSQWIIKYSTDNYGTNNKFIWTIETVLTLGIIIANNRLKYKELNIEPKIKEFCNCLKAHNALV